MGRRRKAEMLQAFFDGLPAAQKAGIEAVDMGAYEHQSAGPTAADSSLDESHVEGEPDAFESDE